MRHDACCVTATSLASFLRSDVPSALPVPDPIAALKASASGTLATYVASCLSAEDADALHVDAARELLRDLMRPVARIDTVPLLQALGRTLFAPILAPMDVPRFDNAAMDGYAFDGTLLEATPTPGTLTLTVIGNVHAGHPLSRTVSTGECARVMTGAPMPPGTDTLIPHEYATPATSESMSSLAVSGHAIKSPAAASGLPQVMLSTADFRKGANRRLIGEDVRCGQVVFEAGRILRAPDLGILASLGIATVQVRAKLRVAFFSTGDELHPVGDALPPGGLYDSNRYTLYGMLTRLGAEPIDLGVVRDDPAALAQALARAAECADAVISSGGVSAGDADFVRDVFKSVGDIVFWKLAMRPGRPFAFGLLTGPSNADTDTAIPFFGLPGNPVAVVASFHHIVRDALLAAMGAAPSRPPHVRARVTMPIRKRPGRTEFARGIAHRHETSMVRGNTLAPFVDASSDDTPAAMPGDDEWQVTLTGAQGSGVLSSMSKGNCFIILPHERADLQTGDWVDIVFFEGEI